MCSALTLAAGLADFNYLADMLNIHRLALCHPSDPLPALRRPRSFFHRLVKRANEHLRIVVHLLHSPVLALQLIDAGYPRSILATRLPTPFIEHGRADAVLTVQLRGGRASPGLLEHGDGLAIGKTGILHAPPPSNEVASKLHV